MDMLGEHGRRLATEGVALMLALSVSVWLLVQLSTTPTSLSSVPTATPSIPVSTPYRTSTALSNPLNDFKIVGYITYWQYHRLPDINLEQVTHLIWQAIKVSNATDPTLRVYDDYPWDQLTGVVTAAHAKGVKAMVSLADQSNKTDLNEIWKSPHLRAQLVDNLKKLVITYSLDGIDVDNEKQPDPVLYSIFIRELYIALNPLGKFISIAGSPYELTIDVSLADCLDFISVMAYDLWKGTGYPYHSTYDESIQAMSLWVDAGIPKNKLLLGIPFYGRDSGSGFYPYWFIVDKYDPAPGENQVNDPVTHDTIWWNGTDLVGRKADYAYTNKFGGVMVYEVGTDKPGAKSLLLAIFNRVAKPLPSITPTSSPPKSR